MSAPGWFPDPGGVPGQYRYWDGRSWSPTTSSSPDGVPVPEPPPSRLPWLIVGGVLLLVAAIVVWWVFAGGQRVLPVTEDTNSSSPTSTSWNEQNPSSQPPVQAPTNGTMVDCPRNAPRSVNRPPVDGWIIGGGLKYKAIPGWQIEDLFLPWMHDWTAQTDLVYTAGTTRWFSMVGVGALNIADGFDDPKVSTFQVLSCFATSQYYSGYTGRKDILSEAVTINGHRGWHLRSEVYVEMKDLPDVEGDWVDVIVVDLGEPESLGVFMSSVTIGDNARMDLMESAIASLTTR